MMKQKDLDLNWIKNFSKISVKGVCEELGIDRANILRGKASEEKTAKVKNRIKEKIDELEK